MTVQLSLAHHTRGHAYLLDELSHLILEGVKKAFRNEITKLLGGGEDFFSLQNSSVVIDWIPA